MPAQDDPLSTAVLLGFIVSLLIVIRHLYEGRLADRDQQIADRDRRIEKLEASAAALAEQSAAFAASAQQMLNFFIDRETSHRSEKPSSESSGRPGP